MEYTIEEINGMKCIIIHEANNVIRQIPVQALASWGVLLGLTDPGEILEIIIAHQEGDAAANGENAWTPVYERLLGGITELADAGVPAEFMEDLLDPAVGSPLPGKAVVSDIQLAQSECLECLKQQSIPVIRSKRDTAALGKLKGLLRAQMATEIKSRRTDFINEITPSTDRMARRSTNRNAAKPAPRPDFPHHPKDK